jgi:ribosomal protein S4
VLFFIKRSKGKANLDRFHTILESELATVLWRSSFFMSILQVKKYIRAGFVFVNGVMIQKPSFVLFPGDIVSFDKYCLFNILRNVLYRIKTRRLFRFNKNIEVNYNNFTISYIRNLKLSEKPFIFGKVNIRRVPYV